MFLTVSLFDRYMAHVPVDRSKLQLVGSACLWMASKYHDIQPLNAQSLSDLAASSFSESAMVKIEQKICIVLDFNLTVPCSLFFMGRFLLELRKDPNIKAMRKCFLYILEHIIMDSECVGFKSSLKASIALYITFVVFKKDFTMEWQEFCTHDSEEVVPLAKCLYQRILLLRCQDRISKTHGKVGKLINSSKVRKLFQ